MYMIYTIIMLLCCHTAQAVQHEYNLRIAPLVSLHHDDTYTIKSGFASINYGIQDWLDAGIQMQCSFYDTYHQQQQAFKQTIGIPTYNNKRCSIIPALTLRLGMKNITSIFVGAGYMAEWRTEQHILTTFKPHKSLLSLPSQWQHGWLWRTGIGFEHRFGETYGAGVQTSLSQSPQDIEISIGLVLTLYSFL